MRVVDKWTSSGKTFKVGDIVTSYRRYNGHNLQGVVTSIEVCNAGDGHVIIGDNRDTLTDFYYIDFDISYYRDKKLESIGI